MDEGPEAFRTLVNPPKDMRVLVVHGTRALRRGVALRREKTDNRRPGASESTLHRRFTEEKD